MTTYTTNTLTGHQTDEFISLFDQAIGTETQTDEVSAGQFVVTCLELEGGEPQKCRRIEKKLTEAEKIAESNDSAQAKLDEVSNFIDSELARFAAKEDAGEMNEHCQSQALTFAVLQGMISGETAASEASRTDFNDPNA